MKTFKAQYDEPSDTLSIIFKPGITSVKSLLLGEHLLVRLIREQGAVATIEIMNYSLLSRPTAFGMPSIPLRELMQLSQDVQNVVCEVLLSEPVSRFLSLSTYFESGSEKIPVVCFKSVAQAA